MLTVTGDLGAPNKGRRLELALASLERMRRVRLETAEPFLKRRVTFEGVLLSGRQLEDQSLVGEVVHALETARLSARHLTLEITAGSTCRRRGRSGPSPR